MHATQPQGGHCPEPHRAVRENPIVELLTDDVQFRTWLASATLTAAQPPAESPTVADKTAADGYLLTDAGREALGEPASADRRCRKCGQSRPGVYAWDGPLCPDCVTVVPADNEYGYTITGVEQAPCPAEHEAPGTAGRVLRSAAVYLERHGWITGAYYDATTGVFTPPACMVGAIGMVCYGGPVDAPAQHFDDPGFLDFEEAVLHLDRYLLVEDGTESYEFNDARGRTVDQVTDVLRKAAARPAEELIDALRVIDAKNADVAALAELLKPCGIWGEAASVGDDKVQCPSCGRRVPVVDGRLATHLRHPGTPTDNCDGGDPALMGGDVA